MVERLVEREEEHSTFSSEALVFAARLARRFMVTM